MQQIFRSRASMLIGCALLAACAPDAWKPDQPYQQFLNSVQNLCYYKSISSTNVGFLLQPSGSDNQAYFLDVTSRLYAGQISTQDWTMMVTSQLQANATDPGVQCLLDVYAKDQNKPKPKQ